MDSRRVNPRIYYRSPQGSFRSSRQLDWIHCPAYRFRILTTGQSCIANVVTGLTGRRHSNRKTGR